ncbi:MAG TPA: AAA family ATPase [Spirochaetota bacterium]|nr:AAA family ATPase [Spirochaetota bacterium]HPI89427.1 AAA family ATPase [Spirochaetota bacterium]HPR46905.1 AAA family ATPase [Spirochaetota bacterium]
MSGPCEALNEKYRITGKIAETESSVLYRATGPSPGADALVIKIPNENSHLFSPEGASRFKAAASTAASLNHPSLPRVHDYGIALTDSGSPLPYLVMDYLEGETLDKILEAGVPDVNRSSEILTLLLQALNYLHLQGIIHGNLCPGNIMIQGRGNQSEPGKIILLGMMNQEPIIHWDRPADSGPHSALPYYSPEQFGIIDREMDHRSDLYSLGVLMYHLLTGTPPFRSERVSSLAHMHAAQIPEPLSGLNKPVPREFETIVFTLINKDPDERFQNISQLMESLDESGHLSAELNAGVMIQPGPDNIPFLGREKELRFLRGLVDQVIPDKGRAAFIHGEAGSGKTTLLQQVETYAAQKGILNLSGYCGNEMSSPPFSPFLCCINSYINKFSACASEKRAMISEYLRQEIGELASLLFPLCPEIRKIFGDLPEPVSLPGERQRDRFLNTAANFFRHLAIIEGGLILIIEDLHWGDKDSIGLLQKIITELGTAPALVIGTYRDESANDRAMKAMRAEFTRHRCVYEDITCPPLDEEETAELVSSLISGETSSLHDISSVIHLKSGGNPFFSIELFRQLLLEGIVGHLNGRVIFDREKMNTVTIPSSILEIVLKRISALDKKERNLFTLLALHKKTINTELLHVILETIHGIHDRTGDFPGTDEIRGIIEMGLFRQFITKGIHGEPSCFFTHDKVQEAFINQADVKLAPVMHRAISLALEKCFKNQRDKDLPVFDLAFHFIKCNDWEKSIKYAILAGDRAFENHAHEQALYYYRTARGIIEENTDELYSTRYREWILCLEGIGRTSLIAGYNDLAIEVFTILLEHKKEKNEQALLYRNITSACFKKGDWPECEKNGKKGLSLLKESLPTGKAAVIISIIRETAVHLIRSIFRRKTPAGKNHQDRERFIEIIWFYERISWMYMLSDTLKFTRMILRMTNLAESRIGHSRELGMCYGAYASLCMSIPLFNRAEIYHRAGLEIREELGDRWGIAQSLQWIGFLKQWQGKFSESNEYFYKSMKLFEKTGDLWETGMSCHGINLNYLYMGDYSKSRKHVHTFREISEKIDDHAGVCGACDDLLWINTEQGDLNEALERGRESLSISTGMNLPFHQCINYTHLAYYHMRCHEYDEAVQKISTAEELMETNSFLRQYIIEMRPLRALIEIYSLINDDSIHRFKTIRREIGKLKKYVRKSLNATSRWKTHHGMSLLAAALLYSIQGKSRKAEKYFLLSLDHEKTHGRKYKEACTLLDYSRFLSGLGRSEEAETHVQRARELFNETGVDCSPMYRGRTASVFGNREDCSVEKKGPGVSFREYYLKKIIELIRDVNQMKDNHRIFLKILTSAMEITGSRKGCLIYCPGSMNNPEILAQHGIGVPACSGPESGLLEDVLLCKSPVIINRENSGDSTGCLQGKSKLCAPIIAGSEILGACFLCNDLSSNVYSEEDADYLGALMAQTSLLVQKTKHLEEHEESRQRLEELNSIKERFIDKFHRERLSNLQDRMKPHFFFNAINTVHALISGDPKLAEESIIILADIYRYLLDHSFESEVPFTEEWNFSMSYIEFEKIRFPKILACTVKIKGNFDGLKVPPLTVQPLVENAIKHGIRQKTGKGLLAVTALRNRNGFTVEVTDNGPGPQGDDLFSRSLGNIRDRLRYLYPGSGLTLERTPEGTTVARVKIYQQ